LRVFKPFINVYKVLLIQKSMTETLNLEKMYRELLALKKEMHFIKTHVVDIMSDEEELQLDDSLEDHKKGKTIRLEDLKNKLGD